MKLRNLGYAAVVVLTAAAFVIGSAATGEAKSKKKKEAAPPPPAPCWFNADKPVCATKGGLKFTYKNACYAANDGAKVTSDKACPPQKAKKAGKKKSKTAAKKPTKK